MNIKVSIYSEIHSKANVLPGSTNKVKEGTEEPSLIIRTALEVN